MRQLPSRLALLVAAALTLVACGGGKQATSVGDPSSTEYGEYVLPDATGSAHYKVGNPYRIGSTMYYPEEDWSYDEQGIASWYGPKFHGRATANGEVYDMNVLSAAHPTLQMPSVVKVTNLENGRALRLRVNDRGPYARGRVIDVSRRAAQLLGFERQGTAKVRVQILPEESRQVADAVRRGQPAPTMLASASGQAPQSDTGTNGATGVNGQAGSGGSTASAREPAAPQQPEPIILASAPSVPVTAREIEPPEARASAPSQNRSSAADSSQDTSRQESLTRGSVTMEPVSPTRIYVQAGAFSQRDNADQLKSRLNSITDTRISETDVDGRRFYRVRMGPIESVDEADIVLAQVIDAGQPDARIIVD